MKSTARATMPLPWFFNIENFFFSIFIRPQINAPNPRGYDHYLRRHPSVYNTMLSRNLLSQSIVFKTAAVRTTALAFSTSAVSSLQLVSKAATDSKVPAPTEKVPDVETFLTKIGRKSAEAADNFESWQDLFTMSSYEMKSKGIETRTRR